MKRLRFVDWVGIGVVFVAAIALQLALWSPASAIDPQVAQPVAATSGNVAAGVATATLPAQAAKTTYLSGFVITAAGSTAALPVNCTVSNVIGGTQSYTFSFPAGVLVGAAPLVVTLPAPYPANAQNTTIAVSCPSGGAGNTNTAVNAFGYIQ